ncbi:hypothetical protein [Flavobacterium rhizosphaerae]|uniref:Uncharacterized protein n=1 Tax=Flavobacterium rhizosphaerae TaxID=3163298 RepID=A0ABW8YXI3_9FLAO
MINPEARVRIKVMHGNYYITKIKEVLLELGVVNRNDKPFDSTTISKVFNGERDNLVIEAAIKQAYPEAFQDFEETKKPEDATSGSGIKI